MSRGVDNVAELGVRSFAKAGSCDLERGCAEDEIWDCDGATREKLVPDAAPEILSPKLAVGSAKPLLPLPYEPLHACPVC